MTCFRIYFRTEKNACSWSVEKLKELLVNLRIENDIGKIVVCILSVYIHIEGFMFTFLMIFVFIIRCRIVEHFDE